MDKTNGRVLIVDDDQAVLYTAKLILKPHFREIVTESSPSQIISHIKKEAFDVILLDMNFAHGVTHGQEGMRWLREIMKNDPHAHVIVNTAYGDIELAVAAMKEGAVDFIIKPWEKEKLIATVLSIYQLSQSKKEVTKLKHRESTLSKDLDSPYAEIISESAEMDKIFSTIDKVAVTDANVLILGENGTGKELVARAIHRKSQRAGEAFIKVDLGAISENLFESELFGHVKGAFTDAHEDRAGRFETASGGTLFLDEIGNLSLPLQAKLLTAIQSREIIRVGSNQPIPIDVRIISATNLPIQNLVADSEMLSAQSATMKQKYFRQDLLYRINTVEIDVPPLRERHKDIRVLAQHYLSIYKKKYQKPKLEITGKTLHLLEEYTWPGNVRELQHALERAVILSDSHMLSAHEILPERQNGGVKKVSNQEEMLNMEEMEKVTIRNAIRKNKGNLSKAAEELGLGRSTLYRKISKYGL